MSVLTIAASTVEAEAYGSSRKRVALALLLGIPILSSAQTQIASRHTIRLQQVVAALDAAEVPLEGAEVRLLAQNIASTAEPRLEVRGLEAVGLRGARVRMGCEAHEQCLPFYVGVTWEDAAIAKAALHSEFSSGPGSGRSTPTAQLPRETTRGAAEAASPGKIKANGVGGTNGPDVHPGSHATLLIDGQRLHIKLPVVCLEKGSPGRTIRVTSLDHKQTYLAEVIDSTLLKGTL